MPKDIRAIIFDMDGLMADTERLYIKANEHLAARYGKTVTMNTIHKMMGRGTLESLQIFADDLQIADSAANLHAQREELMLDLISADLVIMPGLKELLEFVGGRFVLGVATGSSERLMKQVLGSMRVTHFFQILQCSDTIQFGKPHPEVYLRTIARLGVRPEQCIVLEDSSNGCRAGVAAGCYVIAVPNEHTREQDHAMAHAKVSDLQEALTHIRELTM